MKYKLFDIVKVKDRMSMHGFIDKPHNYTFVRAMERTCGLEGRVISMDDRSYSLEFRYTEIDDVEWYTTWYYTDSMLEDAE